MAYLTINRLSQLIYKLKKYKIPTEMWGSGYKGTVQGLFGQISSKKTWLMVDDGVLVAQTQYVLVELYHPLTRGLWHRLTEIRKEMPNGSARKFDHIRGFRKKICIPDEKRLTDNEWLAGAALETAKQAILKEICLRKPFNVCGLGVQHEKPDLAPRRYVGLPAKRIYHRIGAVTMEPIYRRVEHMTTDPDGVKTDFVFVPVSLDSSDYDHVPQQVQELIKHL